MRQRTEEMKGMKGNKKNNRRRRKEMKNNGRCKIMIEMKRR